MNKGKLKLFIWEGEGVLEGDSSGLICALAHDLPEALKLIENKDSDCMKHFPHNQYKIVEQPEAFLRWGGDF